MAIELQVHVGTLCLYLGVPCWDSIFKVPTSSYLHVKDVLMIFSASVSALYQAADTDSPAGKSVLYNKGQVIRYRWSRG